MKRFKKKKPATGAYIDFLQEDDSHASGARQLQKERVALDSSLQRMHILVDDFRDLQEKLFWQLIMAYGMALISMITLLLYQKHTN